MIHAFISDGRLFMRNPQGQVREIQSPFVEDKINRSEHSQHHSGWKSRESQEDMFFQSRIIWGKQAAPSYVSQYCFQHVLLADDHTLYYTLTNRVVTGLFEYDTKEQYERRLFHKNELSEYGFDFSPVRNEFVMAVGGGEERIGLVLLNDQGSFEKELTIGESRDTNPSFSHRNPNQVLYQSSGIARNDEGFTWMLGPTVIYRLDLDTGDIDVPLSDDQYDYLLPREDRDGNLYCIRRPYRQARGPSPLHTLLYILLFPIHFLVALVGFFDAFTRLFNQKSLKTLGPQIQPHRHEKYIQVLGQTINLAKIRRNALFRKELSLVPKNWELIRLAPGGTPEVIACNVASYDVDADGNLHYTNGYRVHLLDRNQHTVVFRHTLIEQMQIGKIENG